VGRSTATRLLRLRPRPRRFFHPNTIVQVEAAVVNASNTRHAFLHKMSAGVQPVRRTGNLRHAMVRKSAILCAAKGWHGVHALQDSRAIPVAQVKHIGIGGSNAIQFTVRITEQPGWRPAVRATDLNRPSVVAREDHIAVSVDLARMIWCAGGSRD